ncbi:MAG: ferrous iron transport protein B [Clostridia bacterium]
MKNFALVGNQNSGKTTLFNALTGSRARVGNWPGVTVDRKEGTYKKLSEAINIVDLPGIYSLSPYTPEEVVSRNYILDSKPDCIINIVDASNLERNLYLTTQLLEINAPIVVALNMIDVVEKRGDIIDVEALQKQLGVPVVAISALKNRGIKELAKVALQTSEHRRSAKNVFVETAIEPYIQQVKQLLEDKEDNDIFKIIKLIEQDELVVSGCKTEVNSIMKSYPDYKIFDGDFMGIIADLRYKYIEKNLTICLTRGVQKVDVTEKIDKVLTNKWAGIPIFLLLMFTVFHLTFSENFLFLTMYGVKEGVPSLGVWLQSLLNTATSFCTNGIAGWLASSPAWVSGLIINGFLAGINAVLSFLPQIMLLFLFISILENSGYMARVAFLLDRAFRKFGLSGRAFMPLLSCFGCAVPGIMGTKTLDSEREKHITIAISPFFSCGAKLPIWATVSSIVFGRYADFGVFGIYILGIVVAILSAIILSKTTLKGEQPQFLLELPQYHIPQAKNTLIYLWERLKHYLMRAATVIAGATVVLWFLGNFTWDFTMVEPYSKTSIIGCLGTFLKPLFVPLGFGRGEYGWMFIVAMITGLIAKEMVVATLGVLGATIGLDVLIGSLSPFMAISFMAFNLLSIPCMAAVSATKAELGAKKTKRLLVFWIITAYIVCLPFGLISFAGV